MIKNKNWVGLFLPAFVLLFLFGASYLQYPWLRLVFIGEQAPATWLSGSLLFMGAAFTLVLLSIDQFFKHWLLLFWGLILLSLDEYYMLHERVKDLILLNLFQKHPESMGLRGEGMIIFYLGLGLILLFHIYRKLWPLKSSQVLMGGVSIGMLSFSLDIFTNYSLLEEILKLIGELLFVMGLWVRMMEVIKPGAVDESK